MRTVSLLFITIVFLFSCTTPKTDTQQSNESATTETDTSLAAQLQGDWVSSEDSLYVISFRQDQYFTAYAGILDPSTQFKIVDTCEGAMETGEYLQLTSPAGVSMCYNVFIKGDELSLLYLAEGNTLRFKKK